MIYRLAIYYGISNYLLTAVITLKEIGKFSVGNFIPALLGRRQFITTLILAGLLKPHAYAALENLDNHFYLLNLNTGLFTLPKSVMDHGQPGSIIKLVTTAAILEENLPAAIKTIDCRGTTSIDGQTYMCRYSHGALSLVEALGQSCNVFFAQATKDLNIDSFLHYLQRFGLHQTISTKHAQHCKITDLALGLGQEYNFSAMQIIQLITSIAKKGKPLLNKNIKIDGVELKDHTWNILQTGMQIAVQRGTAKNLDPTNKLHLAVKTGTTVHGKTFQSWLAGYFPFESPHYVFCLRAQVGTSYDRAVPLAKKYLFAKDWS